MREFAKQLRLRSQSSKRRIIFPEHGDERVQAAIRRLVDDQLCQPVILEAGSRHLECEIFSQNERSESWFEKALRAHSDGLLLKRRTLSETKELLQDPLFLAATLVKVGYADAGVAGCVASTAKVIKACLSGIGLREGSKLLSSIFLMEHPYRLMTYGDCAVNPNPDAQALAQIAIDSARSHETLTGEQAKVALLSFSTHGSAKHPDVDKVTDALNILKQRSPQLQVDGELQADAALVPEIGMAKAPSSDVAGHANVLIYPNLNAGNIAYKLTERLGGATAIGPILQGLDKPWIDLSRGCSVDDIVSATQVAAALVDGL